MKDKLTLKWLYGCSKKHLPQIFFLSVMRSALTVLNVLFALSSKYIVDAAVSGNREALFSSAGMLLLIIVSKILIRILGQSLELTVTARLNMHIRGSFFSNILKRDYSALSLYHSGDLLTRLSDDVYLISEGIVALIPSAISLIVGLVYAFYSIAKLDMPFAFIFLIGGVVLFGVLSLFKTVSKRLHKNVQEAEGKVRSFYQEALASILMVKVFSIEDTISKKGGEFQSGHISAVLKRRTLSIFASGSLGFVFSIGSLFALVRSAYRLYAGTITFGTLTAIIQLVNQIQTPFASLSGLLASYYSLLASAERIIEVETLPEEECQMTALDVASSYSKLESICFDNVTFGYKDDEPVLRDANLSIKKGDFAVIGGISGIGKSTLVKLLLGVFPPQSGSINLIVDGKAIPVGKHSRPLFSYVPQGNLLLSGTIRETVSVVREGASDQDIMRAAEISCAAEFIDRLPKGLDTYIGEKGAGLSEGQAQRLAIMRAVLSDAPIILLDEATSALDEETEARLLSNLRDMHDKTCIIISHKPAAFEICNKHIFIENKSIEVK